MDLATVIGLVLAWGALLGALLMEGGELRVMINLPAALLVFGGTIGAAVISFRMNQIMEVPSILSIAFREKTLELPDVIRQLVRLAEKARRDGLLALEEESRRLHDPFLKRGLRLAIDGTDPELLRGVLETEIQLLQARHRAGESIFITLGGFAPTLGIIGTVMGLIHMLANLSDPGKMGPLIAGAFIATLYGVSSANLIFLPIANKLRMRSSEEALAREVMLEGILSIQAGDNPRLVEEKLKAYLAPRLRGQSALAGARR
ncbi:MAG TPA: flagellar motor protein [Chthonomonas sp.]|jgi:chemotaxis protein MotA|uniref:flagellar motor protein n=1 Tax=Chthonomonas sp. TaxID=2282153 RepID=UPI002B4AC6F9|nr:flagellar motor protein [Chthonomonas sp.]HLH79190.1 flagellar motor protein [Chthonomonas sp.]